MTAEEIIDTVARDYHNQLKMYEALGLGIGYSEVVLLNRLRATIEQERRTQEEREPELPEQPSIEEWAAHYRRFSDPRNPGRYETVVSTDNRTTVSYGDLRASSADPGGGQWVFDSLTGMTSWTSSPRNSTST